MTFLRLLSVKSSVSLSSARAQFSLEGNYGLVTKLAFQNTADSDLHTDRWIAPDCLNITVLAKSGSEGLAVV